MGDVGDLLEIIRVVFRCVSVDYVGQQGKYRQDKWIRYSYYLEVYIDKYLKYNVWFELVWDIRIYK